MNGDGLRDAPHKKRDWRAGAQLFAQTLHQEFKQRR